MKRKSGYSAVWPCSKLSKFSPPLKGEGCFDLDGTGGLWFKTPMETKGTGMSRRDAWENSKRIGHRGVWRGYKEKQNLGKYSRLSSLSRRVLDTGWPLGISAQNLQGPTTTLTSQSAIHVDSPPNQNSTGCRERRENPPAEVWLANHRQVLSQGQGCCCKGSETVLAGRPLFYHVK